MTILKYRLYPHGTLGRILIDLALYTIDRLEGSIEFNDYLTIKSIQGFINALNTIYREIVAETKGNPFPTTGNDNKVLSRKIHGFIKGNPYTIVDYVLQVLTKGGYKLLEERIVAPSIMRVEFYEYSKKGYVSYGEFKEHPYRRASLLDIALAVVGSYIAISARLENRLYYLIPHPDYIDLAVIERLKEVLRDTIANYLAKGKEPDIIATYKLVREIKKLNVITRPIIGELLVIEKSRNRFVMNSIYKLVSSNWDNLLSKLDDRTARMLDTLVYVTDDIIRRRGRAPISYNVLSHLYKYTVGSDESLYLAVRELIIIADNMRRAEEGCRIGEEWSVLFSSFKKYGVEAPSKLASILASRLSELASRD